MDTTSVAGDEVRIPALTPGVATAVRRYDQERAFVLHPEDYHRLAALEELVAAATALPALELSETAVRAHIEESSPGRSVTDPAKLKALLGA